MPLPLELRQGAARSAYGAAEEGQRDIHFVARARARTRGGRGSRGRRTAPCHRLVMQRTSVTTSHQLACSRRCQEWEGTTGCIIVERSCLDTINSLPSLWTVDVRSISATGACEGGGTAPAGLVHSLSTSMFRSSKRSSVTHLESARAGPGHAFGTIRMGIEFREWTPCVTQACPTSDGRTNPLPHHPHPHW